MAKKRRITSTDIQNILTERFLYKRFKMLALNMFKWTGLEELGIEERHIENWLFDEGFCLAFKDEEMGLMCLKCQGYGQPNVLGDYTKYRATGFGYNKVYDADKCVLIENNKMRMATYEAIGYFTNQLYEIVRTRDTNIKTLKLPFMVSTTDDKELTSKKIIERVEDNEWVIVINGKTINVDEFMKVLPTGVKPFTAELTDQYHDIMNEALTYLGINNANTDKKERLITSEANANNQYIDSCAQMFLEARERACEEINKMFDTNIKVELRNKEEDDYEGELIPELSTRRE